MEEEKIKRDDERGEKSLEPQVAADANLNRRNFAGLTKISLVGWRGPNYMADTANDLCFC